MAAASGKENKAPAVIGFAWEPKLPRLPIPNTASTSSSKNHHNHHRHLRAKTSIGSFCFTSQQDNLIDGLYVPPNDLLKKQLQHTAGKHWFDMPAPTLTPELKKDLHLLKVGTVIDSASEFYAGRLTKKERKATLADELLSDSNLVQYRKCKVQEIEDQNRPAGFDKWKIREQKSMKCAKQRRH